MMYAAPILHDTIALTTSMHIKVRDEVRMEPRMKKDDTLAWDSFPVLSLEASLMADTILIISVLSPIFQ